MTNLQLNYSLLAGLSGPCLLQALRFKLQLIVAYQIKGQVMRSQISFTLQFAMYKHKQLDLEWEINDDNPTYYCTH